MSNYSIKDLASLSGIKPHTIRIWEQRYDLLRPERTDSNFRTYSIEDVQYLIRLAGLNLNGQRISALSKKSRTEIRKDFNELCENAYNPDLFVKRLLLDMLNLDATGFNKSLVDIQCAIGFDETCTRICTALINKCHEVLTKKKMHSCYEHFAHALLRKYMLSQKVDPNAIRPNPNPKVFALFLFESNFYEFQLLYGLYKLEQQGHKLIYMGLNVAPDNIIQLASATKIDYLLTSSIDAGLSTKKLKTYISKILNEKKDASILVVHTNEGDDLIKELDSSKVIWLSNDEEYLKFLDDANVAEDLQRA